MLWLRSHPYVASLIGAVILILLGAFVVEKKIAVRGEDSAPRTWGGVGANFLNPISSAPNQFAPNQENLYTEVRGGPPFYYSPTPAQTPTTQTYSAEEFDFNELLSMLSSAKGGSASGGGQTTSDDNSLLDSAYSFIPTGLISTSTPRKERTQTQQALYNYGNEAASSIQSFEDIYHNAPQILKDQFEDRENPAKNNALLALAEAMAGVGRALESMEEVPREVLAAHGRVATSYQDMGEKLSRIPRASSDKALLDAMLAYNATVEAFTKNFVALATLFSAHNVTFNSDDPGSIFTFTNVSL